MTVTAADNRLRTLVSDVAALYPGTRVSLLRGGAPTPAPDRRVFRVILGTSRPRVLVPVEVPTAARAFLRRDSANDSWHDGPVRWLTGLAGSAPTRRAFRTLVVVDGAQGRDGAIGASAEQWLAAALGQPVRIALAGGSGRANAKPVVGVYATDGTALAFAKIGLTDLAARLVRHEASALRTLAAANMRSVRVPSVLGHGSWSGHDVLLMSAVRGRRGAGKQLPVHAMREVGGAHAGRARLDASQWIRGLDRRWDGLPAAMRTRLHQLRSRLLARADADGVALHHGVSHGDWGAWNMAWDGDRAVVWDWERLTTDMPIGVDAVHFAAHTALRRLGDFDGALAALRWSGRSAVESVLADIEPHPTTRARISDLLVDVYLLELATRFASDTAEVPVDTVAQLADWYLRVAEARAALGGGSTEPASSGSRAVSSR